MQEKGQPVWRWLLPLLLSVCSLGVSIYTVRYTVEAGQRADDLSVLRERRESAYERFLDAAGEYGIKTEQVMNALESCASREATNYTSPSEVATICANAIAADVQGPLTLARNNFQGALNSIHLYGSDRALAKAKALAGTLPPSYVKLDGSGFTLESVDIDGFHDAWLAFAEVQRDDVLPDTTKR